MKKKVLHFIRKSSQLNASFIFNQITNHQAFEPLIVFRKNNKDVPEFILRKYDYLDLSRDENFFEKFRFKTCKTLSKRQKILIKNFIRDKNIEICHFHYGSDCGVFYSIQNELKIPSIVSFYGYDAFSFPKRFWGYGKKYLKERVFTKVDKILAMSPEMKNDLIHIGCPIEKLTIHYHGVPSNIFKSVKGKHENVKSKFTLLNISTFDPVKGHIFIFKALRKLINKGISDIYLRIVGGGHYEHALYKHVKENNLSDHIKFLGRINYGSKQMISELENADAFIYPSVITKDDKEGIPGAIVEAMFAGLPVISTYHGGIPYVIENNRTGLLVQEWNIDQLSNAIEMIINDRSLRLRLGKCGQEFALKYLNLEDKENDLERIYSKAIELHLSKSNISQ